MVESIPRNALSSIGLPVPSITSGSEGLTTSDILASLTLAVLSFGFTGIPTGVAVGIAPLARSDNDTLFSLLFILISSLII